MLRRKMQGQCTSLNETSKHTVMLHPLGQANAIKLLTQSSNVPLSAPASASQQYFYRKLQQQAVSANFLFMASVEAERLLPLCQDLLP